MLAVVRLIGYGVQDHYHLQQMDFLFPILVVIPIPSLCDCVWYSVHNQVLNGFIMAYTAPTEALCVQISVIFGFKENLRKPPLKLSELYRKRR